MNNTSCEIYHKRISQVLYAVSKKVKDTSVLLKGGVTTHQFIIHDFFEKLASSYYALRLYFAYSNDNYIINRYSGLTQLQYFIALEQMRQNYKAEILNMQTSLTYKDIMLDTMFKSWELPDKNIRQAAAKRELLDYLQQKEVYNPTTLLIMQNKSEECTLSWISIDSIYARPVVFSIICQTDAILNESQKLELSNYLTSQRNIQNLPHILYLLDKKYSYITPIHAQFLEIAHYYSEEYYEEKQEYEALSGSNTLECIYGEMISTGKEPVNSNIEGFAKTHIQVWQNSLADAIHGECCRHTILFGDITSLQLFYDSCKKDDIKLITI